MNSDDQVGYPKPEPFCVTNVKSLDELKEEFGVNFDDFMYTLNVNLLEDSNKAYIKIYNLKEEKEILLTKLMFVLCPTDHQLDDHYKQLFKEAILNNLDKDTDTIRKILRGIWNEQ